MEIRDTHNGRIHLRELFVDDKSVSRLTVIDYDIRVGSSLLRMGGIAGVGTNDDCRFKGYSRFLLEDTTSYLKDQGHDIAFLFGIPNYYHKFGYSVCLSEPALIIKPDQTEYLSHSVNNALAIRNFADSDVGAIIDLYNNTNAHRTFSLVRYPQYFSGFSKKRGDGSVIETFIIEDENKFCGYFTTHRELKSLTVTELNCINHEKYYYLLFHLLSEVKNNELDELKLLMPIDDPFIQFCRRYNCIQFIKYNRCQGGMGRIINQKLVFAKLIDELKIRIAESEFNMKKMYIHIITEMDTTEISFKDNTAEIVFASQADVCLKLPQSKLIQLIAGYRDIADLSLDNDVELSDNAMEIIDALFPKSEPYLWIADHF